MKLMRTARIERPGAIYDASHEEPTFTEWEMADRHIEKEEFPKIDEVRNVQKDIKRDFEHAWFP